MKEWIKTKLKDNSVYVVVLLCLIAVFSTIGVVYQESSNKYTTNTNMSSTATNESLDEVDYQESERVMSLPKMTGVFSDENEEGVHDETIGVPAEFEGQAESVESLGQAENLETENLGQVKNSNEVDEVEKKLEFNLPISGEITKGTGLNYSKTLDEWNIHNGVDIAADLGAAVCASEQGEVKEVIIDPLMGTTVVLEHANGYKTIYSNLAGNSLVKEGQAIEKGVAIGAVGETAGQEIDEGAHIHFEMLKDDIQVDPTQYIK